MDEKNAGSNHEGLGIDPITDQEEAKDKTVGEKYVDEYFHPHLELPEEMPKEITDIIDTQFADPAARQNTRICWGLLRSGLGDILVPGPEWDKTADAIGKRLSGGGWGLSGTPTHDNDAQNYSHIFINLAIVYGLNAKRAHTGIPTSTAIFAQRAESSKDYEAIKREVAEYIDDTLVIWEEAQKIEKEYDQFRSGLSETDIKGYDEQVGDLEDDIHNKSRRTRNDAEVSAESIGDIIELAKKWETVSGYPWWVIMGNNIHNDKVSEKVKSQLAEIDAKIFDKIRESSGAFRSSNLYTPMIVAERDKKTVDFWFKRGKPNI